MDRIRDMIDKHNLSAIRILEEIRKQGYDGGYTILKDYCSAIRKDRRIPAVYRYETDPGKQSQVDFGDFGRTEIDGISRKLYAFSMILGYSRMRYAEFTTDISTENVIKGFKGSAVPEVVPQVFDGGFNLSLCLCSIRETEPYDNAIVLCEIPELQIEL